MVHQGQQQVTNLKYEQCTEAGIKGLNMGNTY